MPILVLFIFSEGHVRILHEIQWMCATGIKNVLYAMRDVAC